MTDTLGETIRRIRLEKGMTVKEVAIKTQVSPTYFIDIELHQTIPTWERLELIALAIGETIDSLLLTVFPQDVIDIMKKFPDMRQAFFRNLSKTQKFKELKVLPGRMEKFFNCILEIDKKGLPITKREIAKHLGISVYETGSVISYLIKRNYIQNDRKIFTEEDHYGNYGRGHWLQTYTITKQGD